MEANRLARINTIARYTLAFVFIYHGLVPKILWLGPTEIALAAAHNIDGTLVSPIIGVFEILFGLSIAFFRRSLVPIYIAIVLLIILLVDVALVMPNLLAEAFNPVTINIATIVIAHIVCITHEFSINDDKQISKVK